MISSAKLFNYLGKKYPHKYAKIFNDHVGKMCGKTPNQINKILLCLDFDEEVYKKAEEFNPDLIITHHPFIYGTLHSVLSQDKYKEKLYNKVIKKGWCIYSYHTNFDAGYFGMNDALAEALHLSNVYQSKLEPTMRIGTLDKPMKVEEFAKYAKKQLNVSYGLLIAEGKPVVQKVAIIGGGAGGLFELAEKEGADIYISGDIPHHSRRSIHTHQYNYLDLPHEIEKIFMPTMKKVLKNLDNNLDILIVDHEIEPKVI